MTITLSGTNNFLLKQFLQQARVKFINQHGDFGLEQLDGDEVSFGQIREALTSLPFLANKKMVILAQPGAHKQFRDNLESILAEVPNSTQVVIVEPKLDKRSAYYKALKKITEFKEFAELDKPALGRWLVEFAGDLGAELSVSDAGVLIDRVGSNQQKLANELKKLKTYSSKINIKTIELLTDKTAQSTIFEMIDAALAGRPETALRLYEEQRAARVEPPQIIALLAWQLHVLAVIKTAGQLSAQAIASQSGLKPFVVSKNQALAKRMSLAQLKSLIADLHKIDVASKSHSLDTDAALQNYIVGLGR